MASQILHGTGATTNNLPCFRHAEASPNLSTSHRSTASDPAFNLLDNLAHLCQIPISRTNPALRSKEAEAKNYPLR